MVIFHSYVSLPEGKVGYDSWLIQHGSVMVNGTLQKALGTGQLDRICSANLGVPHFQMNHNIFAIICPQEIGESSTRFMRKSLERPVSNQHVTCCWARQSDEWWLDSQQYWHFMATMVISPSEVFLAWGQHQLCHQAWLESPPWLGSPYPKPWCADVDLERFGAIPPRDPHFLEDHPT